MLFHLSFADGLAALENMRRSATWLIATDDPTIWFNSDISTGDYRMLNLSRSPYRLPPPRELIRDDAVAPGRALGVGATGHLGRSRRREGYGPFYFSVGRIPLKPNERQLQ